MTAIYAKHEAYDHRIGKITAEMRILGAPTLRAVEFEGNLFALEGSHRLAAADYLGLDPVIVVECAESDAGLDEFWRKAVARLPRYEFDNLHVVRP